MPVTDIEIRVAPNRQDRAVHEVRGEIEPRDQRDVVLERRPARPEPRRERVRLSRRHERRGRHPQERHHRQHQSGAEHDVQHEGSAGASHAWLPRCSRSCTAVPISMITNSTNAIAAAIPMRHQRKPCWYIISTIVVVLCSGPPCVITYGSANSWNWPSIVMRPTNRNVGPRPGAVMWRKRGHHPAPSKSAASYSSSGMLCSPAMKISML